MRNSQQFLNKNTIETGWGILQSYNEDAIHPPGNEKISSNSEFPLILIQTINRDVALPQGFSSLSD